MDLQSSVTSKETNLVHKIKNRVFPEISITDTISESSQQGPSFRIQDTNSATVNGDLQKISWSQHSDCFSSPIDIGPTPCPIRELSDSPEHYRRNGFHNNTARQGHLLNVSPSHSNHEVSSDDESSLYHSPSSPLLVAMRSAVDSLNKYEDFKILEKIGAGFFAEVFKVIHIPTNQDMVLKLNKRMTGLKKLKEVELLKKLEHPNILHYVGACVHNGQLHPLTEYMNGGALEQLIQNKSIDFPWSLRVKLAQDISKGMEYLHNNGMFHRDLNSKNVLLRKQNSDYTAVVADFGLAAKTPNDIRLPRHLRRHQSIVGNPYWMAPEILNSKSYDEKADVFSYGIVLCELITRLDADPDDLRRRKDYGIDEDYVRSLSGVLDSGPGCPQEFLDLAFQCCKILSDDRPNFLDIKTRLFIVMDMYNFHGNDSSMDGTIQPMPITRLSLHELGGGRLWSSSTPCLNQPSHDYTIPQQSKETTV